MATFIQNKLAQRKDRLAQRDIDNPTVKCSKQKGVINVSVQGGRAPLPPPALEAVPGVMVGVAGLDNPPAAATQQDGRKGFGPLQLGNYTVSLHFPGNLPQEYDITNIQPPPPDTKNISAKTVTQYDFLVPWHWIEYDVKDPANSPVPNLDYKLLRLVGINWTLVQAGTTPQTGKVVKDKIPAGTYRLSIPVLTNPVWSNLTVTVGVNQTLTVDAPDFDAGTNGQFQIVDAFDDSKVIHTLPANVAAGQMQVNWVPAAGDFTALTQSRVRFKATAGNAICLSGPIMVINPENVRVEDPTGTAVNTPINVYFSGGGNWNGASAGGQANIPIPWKETIVRIDLTALNRWRTKVENGGPPDNILTKP